MYSVSCRNLARHGTYRISNYVLTIDTILKIHDYDNTGIIVFYKNSYLKDFHPSQRPPRQIRTEKCITKGDGSSYLVFAFYESEGFKEITHLLLNPSLCSLTDQLSKCTL